MHAYMYGWNSSFSNCRIDQNEHGGTYVGVQHGDQSVHTRMHVIKRTKLKKYFDTHIV